MPAKPTELRKLTALLDNEAPSAEWLAEEVFNMVEQMLIARERYVVFAVHPSLNLVQAVGPYDTKKKLESDWAKRVGAYDRNSKAIIALLKHQSTINTDEK